MEADWDCWRISLDVRIETWNDEIEGLINPWTAMASHRAAYGDGIILAAGAGKTRDEALRDLKVRLIAKGYTVEGGSEQR